MDIFDDIQQWLVVRKALKEDSTKELFSKFKYELRTDNIGRVYTVMNIPESLLDLNSADKSNVVWPWVVEQLRLVDELLIKIRLNELLYPDINRIPNTNAYLMVLTPSTESISIWKLFLWLINIGLVVVLSLFINGIFFKIMNESIYSYVQNLLI